MWFFLHLQSLTTWFKLLCEVEVNLWRKAEYFYPGNEENQASSLTQRQGNRWYTFRTCGANVIWCERQRQWWVTFSFHVDILTFRLYLNYFEIDAQRTLNIIFVVQTDHFYSLSLRFYWPWVFCHSTPQNIGWLAISHFRWCCLDVFTNMFDGSSRLIQIQVLSQIFPPLLNMLS